MGTKRQWNSNQNTTIFIEENIFGNDVHNITANFIGHRLYYGDIWRQWNCHFAPLIIMTCIVAKHTTWHLWKRCDAWFVSAYWRKCSSGYRYYTVYPQSLDTDIPRLFHSVRPYAKIPTCLRNGNNIILVGVAIFGIELPLPSDKDLRKLCVLQGCTEDYIVSDHLDNARPNAIAKTRNTSPNGRHGYNVFTFFIWDYFTLSMRSFVMVLRCVYCLWWLHCSLVLFDGCFFFFFFFFFREAS